MKNINLKIMRPLGFHKNIETIIRKALANVKKKEGWKKDRKSCPICGSQKNKIWLKKNNINIFECANCETGYSSKIPKNLSDIYDLNSEIKDKIKVHKKRSNYISKNFLIDRLNIIKKFKKKGKLLDFGCGTGEFANLAKKNYDVYVYDFSEKLLKFVSKKYDLKICKSLNQKKEKYDIITLYDVIEHLENPTKILKLLKDNLKKSGILVIYTPNKNSFAFNFLKEKSNLCTTPFHLVFFTRNSFKKIETKNFKIKYLKTFGLDMVDIAVFLRDFKKIKFKKEDLNKFLDLQKIIDDIDYSNHIRVILQKI
jgi:2-polyprenyl-3-methyl-5-hydroxy-6-metoxy-1,4-benzoquinol methylase